MEIAVKKWGHSLGVRLPKIIAESIGIHDGSLLEIDVKDGALEITKKDKGISLKELLSNVNDYNLHSEIDSGSSVGNEL
jgi:antitoxin MazE